LTPFISSPSMEGKENEENEDRRDREEDYEL
jgi:hypothetical protein